MITDKNEINDILLNGQVIHIAFNSDKQYPYVVPLCYVSETAGDEILIYIHCAKEGYKIDLLNQDPHIAFSIEIDIAIIKKDMACNFGMAFRSVCGIADAVFIDGDEKVYALKLIAEKYGAGPNAVMSDTAIAAVNIIKLKVVNITGKKA